MNKDTQSWSNSNLTEMEELLQKVQQLETENVALREELQQSEDRFRNIPDEVWSKADLVEMTNKALEERDDAYKQNAALRKLINEPYQFFRFGHKALFPWGKFLDRWCKRAEKLGFKKEAKP
jgi:regulator of replication initiation timing